MILNSTLGIKISNFNFFFNCLSINNPVINWSTILHLEFTLKPAEVQMKPVSLFCCHCHLFGNFPKQTKVIKNRGEILSRLNVDILKKKNFLMRCWKRKKNLSPLEAVWGLFAFKQQNTINNYFYSPGELYGNLKVQLNVTIFVHLTARSRCLTLLTKFVNKFAFWR